MTQSITTKYNPATNTKPAQMSAQSSGGIRRRYAVSIEHDANQSHAAAAQGLATELKWRGNWQGAALGDRGDMVWVCVDDSFAHLYRFNSVELRK